jgi:hypothetical protein
LSLVNELLNLSEGKNRSSLAYMMIFVNILGLTVFLEGIKYNSTKQLPHEYFNKLLHKGNRENERISTDNAGISKSIDKPADDSSKIANEAVKNENKDILSLNDKILSESVIEKQDNTKLDESMFLRRIESGRRIRDNVVDISEIAAERKSVDTKEPLKKLVWRFPK